MSLRDQLLKAGLVTEEQARKAEGQKRKSGHQGKKNKKLGAEQAAQKQQQEQARQAEQAAKRERDKALNREREQVRRRRENAARIRQMVGANRVNDPDAEVRYNFSAGKVVRSLRVTERQQRQLALGRLAIVRNPQDEFDFPLVPRKTAEAMAEVDPKLVLLMYDETSELEDDDWGEWPQS